MLLYEPVGECGHFQSSIIHDFPHRDLSVSVSVTRSIGCPTNGFDDEVG